ncbi:MAG: OmcA/MtrC family decaheme c-type cytochrome [Myxococcaceae bacterium]
MRSHISKCCLVVAFIVLGCKGSNGVDGKPCTVVNNGDGSATIKCPDGSTTTINSGSNGTDGTNGTNGTNGNDGTNGANGDAGVNGTSCTVTQDADAGTKTITCSDGTSVTLTDGHNGTDANLVVDFSELTPAELLADDFTVTVQSVSADAHPVVKFTVRDIKGIGMKNIPPNYFAGLSVLQLVPGVPTTAGNGLSNDTWVSHITNCDTCTSSTETGSSSSVKDNGDGTYTYTFVKDVINPTPYDGGVAIAGVAFDAGATHRFVMRFADPASDSSGGKINAFRPVDATLDYIPATGDDVTGLNDKVNTDNCLTCHTRFRAGPLNAGGLTPFHGGQRYDVRSCVACHNDQRKYAGSLISGNAIIGEPTIDAQGNMTPPAGRSNVSVLHGEAVINLPVFIHKIHAGEFLTLKGNYAGIGTDVEEFAFPQDLRNCTKCHSNAAQAGNFQMKPSRRACGGCHDKVNFETGEGHNPLNLPQHSDDVCNLCHDPAYVTARHLPVALPDPTNALVTPGGSANTNASWMGDPSNMADGGRSITYDLASVTTTDGGPTGVYPVVRFRLMERDAGVVLNTPNGSNEMITGFVGGPSVYCVFTMPQDGLATPADFNASMSGYLRSLWAGTATSGSGAGNLTGPDTAGYYTATLTGGVIPPSATQLTCGLGYTYSLPTTMPLTQTDLAAYPYVASNKSGGLSVPAPNAWKVATGYTGRRGAVSSDNLTGQVVSTARCQNCHAQLGVTPNYHAGQRNNPATCSFCHNPNKTSSGWSAGSGSFIHAIHAAKKRTVPFNWHAVAATADDPLPSGFWGVNYPGMLNNCETCHNPGTYDLSGPWYTDVNLANRLHETVATGKYDAVTLQPDGGPNALAVSISPYVNADGGVNYGSGYSYNLTTQAVTQAASSTLVISPIANNCFGCHDSNLAMLHMETNGASIYTTRAAAGANTEQCMVCHGPGRMAAIGDVHKK